MKARPVNKAEQQYELTVVRWQGKLHCVYLNNHRIAGGKPWGGGETAATFKVSSNEIAKAIRPAPNEATKLADFIELEALPAGNFTTMRFGHDRWSMIVAALRASALLVEVREGGAT